MGPYQEPPQAPQPYYGIPPRPTNPVMELLKMARAMAWSTSMISFVAVILFSFAAILAMTPAIQEWITTPVPSSVNPGTMVYPQEDIFLITPFYHHLFYLDGIGFQVWHLLIIGIFTAGFVWALYEMTERWASRPNGMIHSLMNPGRAGSSLEGVAKLFFASIFFSYLYFLFLSLIQVEMNTPDFDSMSLTELTYSLFSATVFEELISRVLLIGVPLALLGLALKWKKPHRKLLGGGLDLTWATMTLITFSAVIFAFAHAGGWDYWKVPQVLVPGMALGWAFVRYGLHASILIHFSMNCTGIAAEIWPDNMALLSVLGFVMLIWVVTGAYFLYSYSKKLVQKLILKAEPGRPQTQPAYAYPAQHSQPQPPLYPPQPPPSSYYQQPPQSQAYPPPPPYIPLAYQGGFVCPRCGHTDATYEPGRLICLRCGQSYYREMPAAPPPGKEQFEF